MGRIDLCVTSLGSRLGRIELHQVLLSNAVVNIYHVKFLAPFSVKGIVNMHVHCGRRTSFIICNAVAQVEEDTLVNSIISIYKLHILQQQVCKTTCLDQLLYLKLLEET